MGGHGTLIGARHCDAPRRRSCGGGAGRLVRAACLLSAGCCRAPPAAPLLHPGWHTVSPSVVSSASTVRGTLEYGRPG